MNGFIDEVCTQGKLFPEVYGFYCQAGAKKIEEVVNIFKEKGMKRIILTGMGSSLYAVDCIRSYLTEKGIPALSFSSFELSRFQFRHIDSETMIIAISQSGNSAEVIELVEKAKKVTTVVGIYNNEGSKLSTLADISLPIRAEKEVSITNKTYEFTMLILNILAHRLVGEDDTVFEKEIRLCADWIKDWVKNWRENTEAMYTFAQGIQLFDLLANNASLATARQLSLAYREGLHNCTAVWECADYAHGQYHSAKLGEVYLAQMFFPTFEKGTKEEKMFRFILEHGGKVMLYTASDVEAEEGVFVVKLPRVRESLMPLIESVAAETMLGMLLGPDWIKDH
jgi:glucosamine--fructose-6-phosphate aminotransferase (isomerizing)